MYTYKEERGGERGYLGSSNTVSQKRDGKNSEEVPAVVTNQKRGQRFGAVKEGEGR